VNTGFIPPGAALLVVQSVVNLLVDLIRSSSHLLLLRFGRALSCFCSQTRSSPASRKILSVRFYLRDTLSDSWRNIAITLSIPRVCNPLADCRQLFPYKVMGSVARDRAGIIWNYDRYLMPMTIESGPIKCSTRVSRNPASFIHPEQSAPV
jgi:hypothetical protein